MERYRVLPTDPRFLELTVEHKEIIFAYWLKSIGRSLPEELCEDDAIVDDIPEDPLNLEDKSKWKDVD